jgi:hypothetical protein
METAPNFPQDPDLELSNDILCVADALAGLYANLKGENKKRGYIQLDLLLQEMRDTIQYEGGIEAHPALAEIANIDKYFREHTFDYDPLYLHFVAADIATMMLRGQLYLAVLSEDDRGYKVMPEEFDHRSRQEIIEQYKNIPDRLLFDLIITRAMGSIKEAEGCLASDNGLSRMQRAIYVAQHRFANEPDGHPDLVELNEVLKTKIHKLAKPCAVASIILRSYLGPIRSEPVLEPRHLTTHLGLY